VSEQSPNLTRAYAHQVGQRLRAIRRQKGLSLQEVEASSDQEFKASVLGAYERGERVISVSRLQRLAGLYNVPVDQLLPPPGDISAAVDVSTAEAVGSRSTSAQEKVTFDLARLEQAVEPELEMLNRYLKAIMVQRQDFNGRMLTIRNEDIRAISGLLGIDPSELVARLDAHRLRVSNRAVLADA
jgi:transcriptional regulator with XRE-family HTH domain